MTPIFEEEPSGHNFFSRITFFHSHKPAARFTRAAHRAAVWVARLKRAMTCLKEI
jgi:hypothetical protein